MYPYSLPDTDLDAIERLLSPERFSGYMQLASGSRNEAHALYLHNIKLSASLFEVIGGFEVALRNSIHLVLSQALGSDAWYENFQWKWYENEALDNAKKQIRSRKTLADPGRIIAELTFGFWCGLTSRPYETVLWIPHLHKAFPNKRLGRKDAFDRLDAIRKLRNRIAHHQCILRQNPSARYNEIIDAVGWICPTTSKWIESFTSFPELWQTARP